jgi:hypothetical protein
VSVSQDVVTAALRSALLKVGGAGLSSRQLDLVAAHMCEAIAVAAARISSTEPAAVGASDDELRSERARTLANVFRDMRAQLDRALGESAVPGDGTAREVARIASASLNAAALLADLVAQ